MKFSHEYRDESEAGERENALRACGYAAWRKHKADGTWEVFWVTATQPSLPKAR
jgi:hypothetical protein